MSFLDTRHLPDGRTFRSLETVPLLRDRNPMLGLSWTLVHLMEDDSPILVSLASKEDFMLIVSIGGVDTLLASPSQGSNRYDRDHVMIDHEFVDIISNADGVVRLDMTRLHDTVPIGI
ncbi:hypothetical protein [uncultured Sphingomonas sp.]|uniref:hypothetical protein n=1 Tax=uncultured Sphingomonas sp. TaxID=158754 RepID=UPI0035C9D0FE